MHSGSTGVAMTPTTVLAKKKEEVQAYASTFYISLDISIHRL